MLIIIGLVILLAAVVVGVTGVVHNPGAAHLLTDQLRGLQLSRQRVDGHRVPVRHGGRRCRRAGTLCAAGRGPARRGPGARGRLELDEARHDADAVTHEGDTGLGDGQHVPADTKTPMAAEQVTTTGRHRFPLGFPPLGRWSHRLGADHHPADTKPT